MKHLAKNLKENILKNKISYAILLLIILFGVYLRFYHIDYPTIGYHNMKEDHYLSLALNMKESGNYLRTTWYDCSNSLNDPFGDPYEKCSANWGETPPAVWSLILFFTLFGWKLWAARLFIIIFGILTVIPLYLIIKKLSKSEYLALVSAFIYTILPLSIFVGRNIQMDAPAYFFSLWTVYYVMRFVDTDSRKDFIIACISFVLAANYKPLLVMVMAALIFIIPFTKYKRYITKLFSEYKIEALILFITIMLSVIWSVYIAGAVMPQAESIGSVGVRLNSAWFGKTGWVDTTFSIFTSEYWTNYKPIIFSYFSDNYSWTGVWLILFGFSLFAIKYKSKLSRFMWGYALGIIVYIIFFAYKWNAHMYYQYPFLLFAALCIANIFFQAGMLLKSFVKNDTAKKIVQLIPLIALLLLIAPFKESSDRMFNTQFFGSDVAGTYINEHTSPSEIFLLERGIQNEVSWTARRFYYAVPDDVETLKRIETEKNLRYIVMTYSGTGTIQQKKSWQYITENYHIAQAGFIQTAQGSQLYHLVLEKGGTFNLTELSTKPARIAETYEMTNQKIPYYVIEQ